MTDAVAAGVNIPEINSIPSGVINNLNNNNININNLNNNRPRPVVSDEQIQ